MLQAKSKKIENEAKKVFETTRKAGSHDIGLVTSAKISIEAALEHCHAMIQAGGLNEHFIAIGIDSFAHCLDNQHSGHNRRLENPKKLM